MRLCVVQTDIAWEDKKKNMEKFSGLIGEAAEQGAELVIFPELSLTGFSMNSGLSEPEDGETVRFFCGESQKHGIAIGFGYAHRAGDRIYNRYCIADSGTVTARYDKLHPFSYGGEAEVFTAGNELCTVDVRGVTVGLTICYDLRFPELYQALADRCQLIINAANWPEQRSAHWNALLKARALECQCYIAACNRVGSDPGNCYSGQSRIYDPEGIRIACVIMEYKQDLLFADISGERCAAAREEFPVRKDRRRDLYRNFYVK